MTLEQVAQGGCGCPIPGGIQGQAGCGSGQPGLLVGDPAHSRGLELHEHCGPFQPRPFYDLFLLGQMSERIKAVCAKYEDGVEGIFQWLSLTVTYGVSGGEQQGLKWVV